MRVKTLTIAVSLALFLLAAAHSARAQKNGEAQFVSFDKNNWPMLNFSAKRDSEDAGSEHCGFFVGYALMSNQEEALVLRVAHLHFGLGNVWDATDVGGKILPEKGLLFITPSRIIFTVERGDKSHGFDVPRTDLKNKPVSGLAKYPVEGLQINLKERLAPSNSRQQKFAYLYPNVGDCHQYVTNPDPYHKLVKRAVNDFNGAMAEFKKITESLKQSGRIQ